MPRVDDPTAMPPLPPRAAAAPRRALLLLTLVVVGAHAWLLQTLPDSLGLDSAAASPLTPSTMVFNTRRLEPNPAPAATAPLTQPAPASARSTRPASTLAASSASTVTATSPTVHDEQHVAKNAAASEVAAAEPQPPAHDTTVASTDHAAKPDHPAPSAGHHGQALVVPGSVRLKYDIAGQARGIHYSAHGTLTWAQAQGHYDAKLLVSVFLLGSRSLTSTGAVTTDGLVPQRFADKARSELATHFLPEQGRISFSANTPDAAWQRGAQDRLSMFLQLASLLAGDPAKAAAGTQVPLFVAGPKDAEEWVFKVGATETLALPIGPTPAVYLLRLPRREYDQKVEIWLAPQLGYLPVRIKQTQHNGDVVDQTLASSTPLP